MKVLLMEDVKKLGVIGDIVDVQDGYARNFLFPKKLAQPATDANLKIIENIKKKKVQALLKEKKEAEALKDKIGALSCTISVEAGEDDKIFGSITSQDVSKALEEDGIAIDKRKIEVPESIKKLGVYHVLVKVHPEVTAELKVWIVKR